jgi:hypothetical protein
MNIGDLKKMISDYNDHVDIVLIDRRGLVYEIDSAATDDANHNPDGGVFEASMVFGFVAGKRACLV